MHESHTPRQHLPSEVRKGPKADLTAYILGQAFDRCAKSDFDVFTRGHRGLLWPAAARSAGLSGLHRAEAGVERLVPGRERVISVWRTGPSRGRQEGGPKR